MASEQESIEPGALSPGRAKPSPRGQAAVHGALVIDKPIGMTSFSAMRRAQRALGQRTAGHAGTLDPMATGVLVVLLGEATKLSAHVMDHDKVYEATILLGVETDTLDAEGSVTQTLPIPADACSPEHVSEVLTRFVGVLPQVPPRFSALKKDGRTHMSRARAGEDFEIEARPSVCHGLELLEVAPPHLRVRVHCGKGYYVRSFARDLGLALGTCAHLTALRRVRVGAFDLSRAVSPELARPSDLIPIPDIVPELPLLVLEGALLDDVRHGRPAALPASAAALAEGQTLLGITPNRLPVALLTVESGTSPRLRVARGFASTGELHELHG